MKFEWLTDPTEIEPPVGPDLEADDDEEFVDRFFDAEGRLPERYFTPGLAPDGSEDRIFDPQSIDFAREAGWIGALLRRSRDARLLSLLARLAVLSGRLDQFTETLEQLALVLETWPAELNPRMDRAPGERRAALEALNAQATVVMPLLHLPLVAGTDVTLRRYMVATGRAEPRASEQGLEAGTDVLAPLRSDASLRHASQAQALLGRARDALHRIAAIAAAHPTMPLRPDLGAVSTALADMQAMITAARPDLPGWTPENSAAPEAAPAIENDPAAEAPAPGPAPVAAPAAPAVPIPDRATALAAIDAAQAWLARCEPSSAAILLVTQARMLVGMSLVQAIELLLPEDAPRAALQIGRGTPFVLPMDRLRALSTASLDGRSGEEPAPSAIPPINDRATLAGTILGVEAYFTMQEPTSPVPVLLARARELSGKRFDAVLAELMAPRAQQTAS